MNTTISHQNDFTILSIEGRLDTITAGEFEATLQQFLGVTGLKLRIDMNNLSYISSSGLRCFIMLLKKMEINNGTLIIYGLTPSIKEVFDMTGFTKLFNIEE